MPIVAIILAAIFLYAYIVFSSVEFGAAVFNFWPKLIGNDSGLLKNYLSPIWETTNVFLVFFVVGMFTFFPGSIIYFGTDLMPLVFTALVFAALRIACMMLIYYGEVKNKLVDAIFLLSCFLFPLVLTGFYGYCLTGQIYIFPANFLGLSLWLLAAAVILLLSATFFRYFAKRENVLLDRFIACLAWIFLAALMAFMPALFYQAPRFFNVNGATALVATCGLVALILFSKNIYRKNPLGSFLSSCLLVAVIFFGLLMLQLPYLVYPSVQTYGTFTDPASFKIMMLCLPIGLICVAPALWLLYRLFAFKGKSS